MKIEVAVSTDVGRIREHNEDRFLVDEKLGLFVACDGMGGHAAGEVAAELTANTVQETLQHVIGEINAEDELSQEESNRIQSVLRNAVENANARVHQLGVDQPEIRGAGTTCTALLIRGGRGFLAHVGDSRAYLRRYGAIHQLTTDHTLIEDAMRAGMDRKEAEDTFGSNVLTRAIGPSPSIAVDSLVFDVLPGDTYLLCSDGLCGYFPDNAELGPLLDGDLAAIPEQLVGMANERGGDDNITAVTLRLADADTVQAERHSRVREDLAALSHMQLFSEMTYPELLEIAGAIQTQEFEDGAEAVTEGETSDCLYVIASGAVKVVRGSETVAELPPGCHFGEIALLTNRPRSATVRAVGPTRLLALHRQAICVLFERRPVIGMKFLWTLAQVQSFRLDEALLWRASAEHQSRPPKSLEGEDGADTQRVFSTPFRRTAH